MIRYDQRGTSRSTVRDRRFGLAEHVEDLEAIREEYGHERLSLLGHPWGGTWLSFTRDVIRSRSRPCGLVQLRDRAGRGL